MRRYDIRAHAWRRRDERPPGERNYLLRRDSIRRVRLSWAHAAAHAARL